MQIPTRRVRQPMRFAAIIALCGAVVAVAWPSAAQAVNAASFTVAPVPGQPSTHLGYFLLKLAPSQTSRQIVLVRNDSAKGIVLQLTTVDATTTPIGGVAYRLPGQPLENAGAWLTLGQRRVSLAPGQVRQVDVVTAVPSGTRPGDYVAGISVMVPVGKAATESSSSANKASVQVNLQTRRVIAVQVRVPGAAVPKLTITGVAAVPMPGGMDLAIDIASPGGNFTSGSGTIEVASTQFSREFSLGLVVPGTSIAYPISKWETAPEAGDYPAHVIVHYGDRAL